MKGPVGGVAMGMRVISDQVKEGRRERERVLGETTGMGGSFW